MNYKEITESEEKYRKFRTYLQEKSDKFANEYLFFAYSPKQFDEALNERNWNEEDILGVGTGAYCHKKDWDNIKEFYLKLANYEEKYLLKPKNFYGALYHALWEIEYCYRENLHEALDYLNVSEADLENFPDYEHIIDVYENAVYQP